MNPQQLDTLMTIGQIALFIGCPTSILTGLAVKLAIRGGIALARTVAVSAAAGAVATGAAYVYMSSQGGGGSPLPGHPTISAEELKVELLKFNYLKEGQVCFFQLDGNSNNLSTEDIKNAISQAASNGKTKEVQVIDHVGSSNADDIIEIRNYAQGMNLKFIFQEVEKGSSVQNE